MKSIGYKIFTVVALLIAGFVVVAVSSMWRIANIRHEIVTLADYHAPMARLLAEIEIHSRKQEAEFYQAMGHVRPTASMLMGADQFLKEEGKASQEKISAALSLAHEGLDRASREDDRIRFAGLIPVLEQIAGKQADLTQTFLGSINRQDGAGSIDWFALDKEIADFNSSVDAMALRLDSITIASSDVADREEKAAVSFNYGTLLISGGIGIILAGIFSRGLSLPLRRLVCAIREVQDGRREIALPVNTCDEVGQLAISFNAMVDDLRAKERIRDMLGKYIDPKIVESIISETNGGAAGGRRAEMSVLFVDMEGFTGLSEVLVPTALVKVLNRYLTLMSAPVASHGGVIDKYIGDAVMAFWGSPFSPEAVHGRLACRAALDQVAALEQLQVELPELSGLRMNVPRIDVHIGIACGEVVVGSIGSEIAQEYTVIGNVVNLASRLDALNKVYRTRILLTAEIATVARDEFECREVDSVRLAGKSEATQVFELLGRIGQVDERKMAIKSDYEKALSGYRQGHWAFVEECLERWAGGDQPDGCSVVLVQRARYFASNPPLEWDGVWDMVSK